MANHIVRVSSNEGVYCPDCKKHFEGWNDFQGAVNHFTENHGYTVLHVGGEFTHGNDGEKVPITVAVLGADK